GGGEFERLPVLPSFHACLGGDVAIAEGDADLAEEAVGRNAAREYPDEVVGELAGLSIDVEQHRIGADFDGVGIEVHIDCALPDALGDALFVPLLNPAEAVL